MANAGECGAVRACVVAPGFHRRRVVFTASRTHLTDSQQDQQDNRLTFVKIGCANLRMLRSDFGRTGFGKGSACWPSAEFVTQPLVDFFWLRKIPTFRIPLSPPYVNDFADVFTGSKRRSLFCSLITTEMMAHTVSQSMIG